MRIIRNIPFVIWFYFNLFSIANLNKQISKHRQAGDNEKERDAILKAENAWGDAIIKKADVTVNVTGYDNIPEGPVLFVSNHQSYFDIPSYFAAIRNKQIGFVAKVSLAKIPAFGSWIRDVRSVFIEREDSRASLRAIEEGVGLLKEGFSLVVFPEGTRSRGPEMGEFKKGSLRLATKAGVPVVPVTLNGTYKVFEEKGYIRAADITFTIHPAIDTKELSKKEINDLSRTVEEIVRSGL